MTGTGTVISDAGLASGASGKFIPCFLRVSLIPGKAGLRALEHTPQNFCSGAETFGGCRETSCISPEAVPAMEFEVQWVTAIPARHGVIFRLMRSRRTCFLRPIQLALIVDTPPLQSPAFKLGPHFSTSWGSRFSSANFGWGHQWVACLGRLGQPLLYSPPRSPPGSPWWPGAAIGGPCSSGLAPAGKSRLVGSGVPQQNRRCSLLKACPAIWGVAYAGPPPGLTKLFPMFSMGVGAPAPPA